MNNRFLVLTIASIFFSECHIIARVPSYREAEEALKEWKDDHPEYRGEAAIVEVHNVAFYDLAGGM